MLKQQAESVLVGDSATYPGRLIPKVNQGWMVALGGACVE
jgi:hypothetical protein